MIFLFTGHCHFVLSSSHAFTLLLCDWWLRRRLMSPSVLACKQRPRLPADWKCRCLPYFSLGHIFETRAVGGVNVNPHDIFRASFTYFPYSSDIINLSLEQNALCRSVPNWSAKCHKCSHCSIPWQESHRCALIFRLVLHLYVYVLLRHAERLVQSVICFHSKFLQNVYREVLSALLTILSPRGIL